MEITLFAINCFKLFGFWLYIFLITFHYFIFPLLWHKWSFLQRIGKSLCFYFRFDSKSFKVYRKPEWVIYPLFFIDFILIKENPLPDVTIILIKKSRLTFIRDNVIYQFLYFWGNFYHFTLFFFIPYLSLPIWGIN